MWVSYNTKGKLICKLCGMHAFDTQYIMTMLHDKTTTKNKQTKRSGQKENYYNILLLW